MLIRPVTLDDKPEWLRMRLALWPDSAPEQEATEMDALLAGYPCLLYTSDAADERSSVDLGGRRIIKKKTIEEGVLLALEQDHRNKLW